MTFMTIFEICASVLASLGGGAIIVTAAAKWCSDFLVSEIQKRQEKDLEKYKAELENASKKLDTLLSQALHIAQKQYDTEVDIYKKIWQILHATTECTAYITDFKNAVGGTTDERLNLLQSHYVDFSNKLNLFQSEIDCNAPFYQKNAFDLLKRIEGMCLELLILFEKSKDQIIRLPEADVQEMDRLGVEIIAYKDQLTIEVRDYLQSLNTISP